MIGLSRAFDFSTNSIARKLVLYLFLCSSVITLFGTSLQLYIEYERDIKSIEKSLSQIEASQIESLIQTLWVSNASFLKVQLDGLLKLPDIAYLGKTQKHLFPLATAVRQIRLSVNIRLLIFIVIRKLILAACLWLPIFMA